MRVGANSNMKQIKVYSFFSGCGLLDLGMEKAGFDIAFVSEKYEPFLKAYKYSRKQMGMQEPQYGYHNEDICNYLKDNSFIDKLVKNDKRDNVVGFVGGPPCPDFSTAGKNKGEKGDNGRLTKIYFDLILKEEPDFFVFENVKGLWKTKKHREFYDKMSSRIRKKGYYVIDKLLNSLEYGVPQERERVVMIGIRTDSNRNKKVIQCLLKDFNWGITNGNMLEIIKNIDWPTMQEFEEDGKRDMPEDVIEELTVQYWFEKNEVTIHKNANDYFQPQRGLERMQTIEEGDVSRKSYKRLHRWRYSPTAAYGNNEVHLHPYKCRRMSVAEVLAIQSAPKEFVLPSDMTLTDKFKTVGNGVPVLMAQCLAKEIKELLEEYIKMQEDG